MYSNAFTVYNALHILYYAEGRDFSGRGGSIIFVPGGEKQQSIMIPITDDQETETDEPLTIRLSSSEIPPDIEIPAPVVTIIDNDIGEFNISR